MKEIISIGLRANFVVRYWKEAELSASGQMRTSRLVSKSIKAAQLGIVML